MNYEVLQLEIKAALRLSNMQYRNEMRVAFEVWSFRTAQIHNVLLEEITRSSPIWNWYQHEYKKVERRFYKENKDFFTGDYDPFNLFEILRWMTSEIEGIYPVTLINNLKNGQRVTK